MKRFKITCFCRVASADYFYYSENGERSLSYDNINGGIIGWCAKTPDGEYFERNFITFFVGPKDVYEKREHELEQFRKGDCEYVMNSLEDLPKPRNQR